MFAYHRVPDFILSCKNFVNSASPNSFSNFLKVEAAVFGSICFLSLCYIFASGLYLDLGPTRLSKGQAISKTKNLEHFFCIILQVLVKPKLIFICHLLPCEQDTEYQIMYIFLCFQCVKSLFFYPCEKVELVHRRIYLKIQNGRLYSFLLASHAAIVSCRSALLFTGLGRSF